MSSVCELFTRAELLRSRKSSRSYCLPIRGKRSIMIKAVLIRSLSM